MIKVCFLFFSILALIASKESDTKMPWPLFEFSPGFTIHNDFFYYFAFFSNCLKALELTFSMWYVNGIYSKRFYFL